MGCVKKAYNSKEEAVLKISKIALEPGNDKKPIRSYKCNDCGKYHLTSWSKNKKKEIANISEKRKQSKINNQAEYWIKKKGWEL